MTSRHVHAAGTSLTALAMALAIGMTPVHAATQTSAPLIVSGTFTDLAIDQFALIGPSTTIVGSFEWGAGTINLSFGPVSFTTSLSSGSVTKTSLGSWTDLDAGPGYRFENIGPGSYALNTSGSVVGVGALRAISTVSAVPEPAGGTFLLAGISALALMQRKRAAAR